MKLIGKLNEFNSAQNKNINNNVTSNQNLKFQNLNAISNYNVFDRDTGN